MSSSISSSDSSQGVRRFLRRAAVLSVASVLVLGGAQWAIETGLRRSKAGIRGTWNRMTRGEIKADLLVVGSSRPEVGIDPTALGKALKTSAFNLSRSGTRPDLQLPFLREFMRRNAKPGLIVQGLDHTSLLPSPTLYNAGQYTPYLDSTDIFESVLRFDPKCRYDRALPLFAFARHRLTTEALRALFRLEADETAALGYFPRAREWQGGKTLFDVSGGDDASETETEAGRQHLIDLIRFEKTCTDRLVLVYLPEYLDPARPASPHPRARVLESLRKIATAEGTPLLDYSADPLCRDRTNFFDTIHLNKRGAERFSARLAEDLTRLASTGSPSGSTPAPAVSP